MRFGHGDLIAWASLVAVLVGVAGIVAGQVAQVVGSVDVGDLFL